MQLTIQTLDYEQPLLLPESLGVWREDEFFQFCQANQDLRIERNAKGEIIVMALAGAYSRFASGEVFGQLRNWAMQNKQGVAFDSSAGFLLRNGGVRSPDAVFSGLNQCCHPLFRYPFQRRAGGSV